MDFGVSNQPLSLINLQFPDPRDREQVVWWAENWWRYSSVEMAREDFRDEKAQKTMRPAAPLDDPVAETNSGIETVIVTRDNPRLMIPDYISKTADHFGVTAEEVTLAVQAVSTAKEATRHAGVWSILHTLTPQQVIAVVENSTVGKLYRRFHEMMHEIVLPAAGFTEKAQSAAAARLSETYRELTKHQKALGIEPTDKDTRVGTAERLRGLFEYPRRKKTTSDRPRRAESPGAPPPP